jgi:hypothetical protein
MPVRIAVVPLLAALLTAACGADITNPFLDQERTELPSVEAALLFSSNAFTSNPNAPRDVYALNEDGSDLDRLTHCNTQGRVCDTVAAVSAPDRERVAARRVSSDSNSDGLLTEADAADLVIIDLERSIQAQILDPGWRVQGVDWSPIGGTIVFSVIPPGNTREDLYRVDANGADLRQLSATADVRERSPRIDPTGTVAVYERIEAAGKGEIWLFSSSTQQAQITAGGPGSEALAGTPYVVGSDANPVLSPDNVFVVFRRLTSTGRDGMGSWDILTARSDGSDLVVLASGPEYRGAPDWGPQGIVFVEIGADAAPSLVVIQPDGSGRRVITTLDPGQTLTYPRWLP